MNPGEIPHKLKVTANLFGLEFCIILKSYHKIAHCIYFVLKKKLFTLPSVEFAIYL